MPKNELQKFGISLCVGVSSFKLSMPVNLSFLKSQHGNRMWWRSFQRFETQEIPLILLWMALLSLLTLSSSQIYNNIQNRSLFVPNSETIEQLICGIPGVFASIVQSTSRLHINRGEGAEWSRNCYHHCVIGGWQWWCGCVNSGVGAIHIHNCVTFEGSFFPPWVCGWGPVFVWRSLSLTCCAIGLCLSFNI